MDIALLAQGAYGFTVFELFVGALVLIFVAAVAFHFLR